MPINRIHSYLVHPSKGDDDAPRIGGIEVPQTGQLFEMLSRLDNSALSECDIAIVFNAPEEGPAQNDSRDLLLAYMRRPSLPAGRAIAERLQAATTRRSGLGLLFLIVGRNRDGHRLLISRFPAAPGIAAEEHGDAISVEFLEKVFMKSFGTYKSALYQCTNIQTGFWEGLVVDRQMDDVRGSADYWTKDFLASVLRSTPEAGTRRLAIAFQKALKGAEGEVRQELINAALLIRNRQQRITNAGNIVDAYDLSDAAKEAIRSSFPRPELFNDSFQFDRAQFDKILMFRAVELDNGVTLTAETATFDRVIHSENAVNGRTRFSTEGAVIRDRLKKTP